MLNAPDFCAIILLFNLSFEMNEWRWKCKTSKSTISTNARCCFYLREHTAPILLSHYAKTQKGSNVPSLDLH